MIPFEKNRQQTIPTSSVKIIGLGGAGANVLDRVALDGLEGAELLALNTDIRTLGTSVAGEKIQLGRNLTKGLGSGGDPELGENAILEAETEIRDSLRDRKIVFICVGLGGGTGSGAAPVLTRLAREAGAFTVVFATMPFAFEGLRRREQAEKSLNQLAVLSNALVTFDNGRMGELVLPKQGVHEAFSAADRMISDSISAVARLVLRPGLINVGLDELMTALKTNRSRCLFGSGLAKGENRAQGALKKALNSPLLDRGTLLKEASTVLVHICGGEDLTMFEVELLMESLTKHIPKDSHLLFGAATDPAMANTLSVTIISALPEDRLRSSTPSQDTKPDVPPVKKPEPAKAAAAPVPEPEIPNEDDPDEEEETSAPHAPAAQFELPEEDGNDDGENELEEEDEPEEEETVDEEGDEDDEDEDPEDEVKPIEDYLSDIEEDDEISEEQRAKDEAVREALRDRPKTSIPPRRPGQSELSFDAGPRGRFEGEKPNLVDGEDLDIPPYLRKKKR